MDAKKILSDVLNIIGYSGDKEEFSSKFFSIVYIEAVAKLSSELSEVENKKLGEELENNKDEEAQKNIILKYLSKEKFDKYLEEITQDQFSDYLETIIPTLPDEKQKELSEYLISIPQPTQ